MDSSVHQPGAPVQPRLNSCAVFSALLPSVTAGDADMKWATVGVIVCVAFCRAEEEAPDGQKNADTLENLPGPIRIEGDKAHAVQAPKPSFSPVQLDVLNLGSLGALGAGSLNSGSFRGFGNLGFGGHGTFGGLGGIGLGGIGLGGIGLGGIGLGGFGLGGFGHHGYGHSLKLPPVTTTVHHHRPLTKTIKIHRKVAVPVPHPIIIPVERLVPIPTPVAIPIERPFPVHVPTPQQVTTVEKPVIVPVEKTVAIPVVRPIHVAVPKPFPVPQPFGVLVTEAQHYPVAVPVPVPQPVAVPDPQHAPQHDAFLHYRDQHFRHQQLGPSFTSGAVFGHANPQNAWRA